MEHRGAQATKETCTYTFEQLVNLYWESFLALGGESSGRGGAGRSLWREVHAGMGRGEAGHQGAILWTQGVIVGRADSSVVNLL